MHWASLKLAFKLVTLLPLVLADCPKRRVLVPRSSKFHELCGEEPGHSMNSDRGHPCFKLESGNLHNVYVEFRSGIEGQIQDGSEVIVKDGDLTHFTFVDTTQQNFIRWNEARVEFTYQHLGTPDGCYNVWVKNLGGGQRLKVKDEDGKEILMEHTAFDDQKPAKICSKWTRLSLKT
ncbi:uncharacterized protein UTRI_03994 [Ustilago trichophora]|uniref:Mig1 protein, induced during biotrophic phase n=1 Tax=Ustilago trichophora TaxID=86804 RepID=A0A5C3E8L1_9BASI|nr:uncharacterized protein UTRI_03994 [Ustilago trichophora]